MLRPDILEQIDHIKKNTPDMNYEEELEKEKTFDIQLKKARKIVKKITVQMNENPRSS